MIDSVFKAVKNYYPQVFLEEYKYAGKEEKISNLLILIDKILMEKIKNTHILKIIFKAYKKMLTKYFLISLFLYIEMVNKYYQKHKERLRKETRERYQNLSEDEQDKKQKKLEKDINILLKKKKKKGNSFIRNVSKSYLSREYIII